MTMTTKSITPIASKTMNEKIGVDITIDMLNRVFNILKVCYTYLQDGFQLSDAFGLLKDTITPIREMLSQFSDVKEELGDLDTDEKQEIADHVLLKFNEFIDHVQHNVNVGE